jgi:hypothetical protein
VNYADYMGGSGGGGEGGDAISSRAQSGVTFGQAFAETNWLPFAAIGAVVVVVIFGLIVLLKEK